MSQVFRERAIGMLTAGMSTRAVAREYNVNFSTISHLQLCLRIWQYVHVGKRFANVNVVNRVPQGAGGVKVWAGISYRQRTQLHFINCNLNAQKYCDEIQSTIDVPFLKVCIERMWVEQCLHKSAN